MIKEKCIQETEVVTQGRLQSLLHNMEANSISLIEVIRRLQDTCERIGLKVSHTEIKGIEDITKGGILTYIDEENKLQSTLLEYIFKLIILLEGL